MIKEYKKKDGSKAYMFVAYLGVDPLTGKQKRTTRRGFKTKRDAKIAEARLQAEIEQNGFSRTNDYTFKEIFDLWYEQYRVSVKPSTLKRVNDDFKSGIFPHFANMKIKSIGVPYCQKVLKEWVAKYACPRKFVQLTSSLFDYAIQMQATNINPFKLLKMPRKEVVPKKSEDLFYTKEELQAFLSVLEGMNYCMFRVLAYTGIRRGELLALQWKDIDFDKGLLTVSRTLALNEKKEYILQTPKSATSYRTISIDNETLKTLKKWRITQQTEMLRFGFNTQRLDQLIFTNNKNKNLYISYLTYQVNSICKQHGLKKITVHGFRHTHCSLLFEAGASLQEVKERLGHTHINTTMSVYAHVTPEQRDTLAEKFALHIN